jgi:hypothetical protein
VVLMVRGVRIVGLIDVDSEAPFRFTAGLVGLVLMVGFGFGVRVSSSS